MAVSLRVRVSPGPRATGGSRTRSLLLGGWKQACKRVVLCAPRVILSLGIDSWLIRLAKQAW